MRRQQLELGRLAVAPGYSIGDCQTSPVSFANVAGPPAAPDLEPLAICDEMRLGRLPAVARRPGERRRSAPERCPCRSCPRSARRGTPLRMAERGQEGSRRGKSKVYAEPASGLESRQSARDS